MSAHRLQRQARTKEETIIPTQQENPPQIQVTYDSEGISLKLLSTVRRQDGTSNLFPDVAKISPGEQIANSKPFEEIIDCLPGPVSEKKASEYSIQSNDSGYITGTSQRNSMIYTSSTTCTLEKKKSTERLYELRILSDREENSCDNAGSSGSSQYFTPQTSARSSLTSDFEDPERTASDKDTSDSQTTEDCGAAISLEKGITSLEIATDNSGTEKIVRTQRSKDLDSCRARDLPLVEKDSPHFRKQRRLSLDTKSASIEVCPSCKNRLVPLPRRSSTESSFSEVTLKLAVEKLERLALLGDDTEIILKQTVQQNAADFRDYIDFTMLAMHLFAENLVHPGENEDLNSRYHTQVQKANYFYMEILGRKGPEAYRSFYRALKAEKKHKGHEYLLKMLEQALDELRKP